MKKTPAARRRPTARPPGARSCEQTEDTSPTPLRVLIVEDNKISSQLAFTAVQALGFTPIEEATVAAGRKRLQDGDPISIVLLDLRMPGEDGYAFLKWIRQRPALNSLRVVVCSALDPVVDQQEVDEAIHLGADCYLRKPIVAHELRQALAKVGEQIPPVLTGPNAATLRGVPQARYRQLLSTFYAELPVTVESLLTRLAALELGNSSGLDVEATAVEGAAGSVGAMRLAALCADLRRAYADIEGEDIALFSARLRSELALLVALRPGPTPAP